MNNLDREVLRRHRVYLVKELMVDVLWPSLVDHGIFTDEMLEHIKATGARPSQVHRLLTDLTRRGPLAFSKFLECLEETDQGHIAERLREAADVISDAEPTFEARRPYDQAAGGCNRVRRLINGSIYSSPPLTASSPSQPSPGPAGSTCRSDDLNSAVATTVLTVTTSTRTPSTGYAASVSVLSSPQSVADTSAGWSSLTSSSSSTSSSSGSPQRLSTSSPSQAQRSTSRLPSVPNSLAEATGEPALPASYKPADTSPAPRQCVDDTAALPVVRAAAAAPEIAQLPATGDWRSLEAPPQQWHFDGEARSTAVPRAVPAATLPSRSDDVVSLRGGGADGPRPSQSSVATPVSGEHPDGPADVVSSLSVCGQVAPGTPGQPVITSSSISKVAVDDLVMLNWNKAYKMTSNPRGYCVIISNRDFSGHLRERIGTDVDKNNLYRLFSQLGYMISIKENLTAMEILITLRDFAALDYHFSVDSCAVVLLTHGLDGQVYGCDCKLVDLSEVFSFFDGHHCPALKGKPKIMFVQACRGEKYDAGFETTDSPGPGLTDYRNGTDSMLAFPCAADNSWVKKLPSCSDFLIAYATIPGHVSWRNSVEGSWFVKAFCDVFSRNAHTDDATSMLVEVNDRVATAYESITGCKQMPAPVVLLRKKLYFNPPLISPTLLMPR